jgi:hypothetical protein
MIVHSRGAAPHQGTAGWPWNAADLANLCESLLKSEPEGRTWWRNKCVSVKCCGAASVGALTTGRLPRPQPASVARVDIPTTNTPAARPITARARCVSGRLTWDNVGSRPAASGPLPPTLARGSTAWAEDRSNGPPLLRCARLRSSKEDVHPGISETRLGEEHPLRGQIASRTGTSSRPTPPW